MSQASIAERPVISSTKPEKETLRHGPALLPREPKPETEEKPADALSQRPLPPIRSFGRRSLNAGADDTGADNDATHGIADTLRGTLDAFRRRISGPFPAESPHVASKNVIIGLTVAAFGVLALALTVYFSTGNGETTHVRTEKAENPAYAQPEPLPAPAPYPAAPAAVQPRAAAPVTAVAPQAPAPKAVVTPKVIAPQAQAPAAPVAQPSDFPEMPDIPGIREAVAPQVREVTAPQVREVTAPQVREVVAPQVAAPQAPAQPVAVPAPAAPQAAKPQTAQPTPSAAPAMALPPTTAPKKPMLDERGLVDILKKQ